MEKNLDRGIKRLIRADAGAIQSIFDRKNIGAIYIPNVVDPDFLKELMIDIKRIESEGKFEKARPKEKSGTTQNLSYFYIEHGKHPETTFDILPAISKLRKEYTEDIYNVLADRTKLFDSVQNVNSAAVNMYPPGVGYIGDHRDYAYNRNLIAIFTLEGYAKCSLARSKRDSRDSLTYVIEPGSLNLLRAPFDKDEAWGKGKEQFPLKPLHKVESMYSSRRISLLFRHVDIEMLTRTEKRSNKY